MKALILTLLFSPSVLASPFLVPDLSNFVNDYAHVLSVDGRNKVEAQLSAIKTVTGAQVGILIVPSLNGKTIESMAKKVANKWKLGSTHKDDGVLLLIAVKERQTRIEIGHGLKNTITQMNSRYITNIMKPSLKRNNYDDAVMVATTYLGAKIALGIDNGLSKSEPVGVSFNLAWFGLGLLFVPFGVIHLAFHTHKNKQKDN